ncbi:hypothetical protein VPH35_116960 [Triticum aestivum]
MLYMGVRVVGGSTKLLPASPADLHTLSSPLHFHAPMPTCGACIFALQKKGCSLADVRKKGTCLFMVKDADVQSSNVISLICYVCIILTNILFPTIVKDHLFRDLLGSQMYKGVFTMIIVSDVLDLY